MKFAIPLLAIFYGFDFERGKFVGAGIKFELGRYHRESR
jgi:hypothetical protein